MKSLIKVWVVIVSLLAGNAGAVSVFTDELAFLAAISNSATDLFPAPSESFGDLLSTPSAPATFTTNSGRVSIGASPNLMLLRAAGGPYGANFLSVTGAAETGAPANVLEANLTGNYNAFGISLANSLGTASAGLTVAINGGTPLTLSDAPYNLTLSSSLLFVGLVSSTPISSVVFAQQVGIQTIVLDTTKVITGIAPVPEPGIAVLMGAGVLLMGAVVRRRRA